MIMDCREFINRLDLFAAGMLPHDEQAAAARHLEACTRCRTLHCMVRGESDPLTPKMRRDLLFAILSQTSGPACGEAQLGLCDYADGILSPHDREVIALHIEDCLECGSIIAALQELAEILPSMAEIEPEPSLTEEILLATTDRTENTRCTRRTPQKWNWGNRLLRRPRFAWEVAYVGTLLFFLALGNPPNWAFFKPGVEKFPRWLQNGDQVVQEKVTLLAKKGASAGGRVVQETAIILAKKGASAKDSLDDLRLRGRHMLETVEGIRQRTTTALRQQMSALATGLRLSLLDGGGSKPQKQDLR
jgi:hypothetical protein